MRQWSENIALTLGISSEHDGVFVFLELRPDGIVTGCVLSVAPGSLSPLGKGH